MERRFFTEDRLAGKTNTVLTGPDAHHIANVIRLKPNDKIVLFDGSGNEFTAQIQEIEKKRINLDILAEVNICRELDFDLTICVSLPKGDRQKFLVEKLAELGVTCVVPINCQRTAIVTQSKSISKMDRWVIEASKQCGRNQLMRIAEPISFAKMLDRWPDQTRKIAHPYQPLQTVSQSTQLGSCTSVVVAIGPEGGFHANEIGLAIESGWQSFVLGRSILRMETAAIAAATLFGLGRQPNNNNA